MKRSEMISLIGNLHPFRMMYADKANRLIDELLTEIEKAGMTPPATTIFNTDENNTPTWEEEDER